MASLWFLLSFSLLILTPALILVSAFQLMLFCVVTPWSAIRHRWRLFSLGNPVYLFRLHPLLVSSAPTFSVFPWCLLSLVQLPVVCFGTNIPGIIYNIDRNNGRINNFELTIKSTSGNLSKGTIFYSCFFLKSM